MKQLLRQLASLPVRVANTPALAAEARNVGAQGCFEYGHLLLGAALLLGGVLLGIGAGRAVRPVEGLPSRQTSIPRGLARVTTRSAHAGANVL